MGSDRNDSKNLMFTKSVEATFCSSSIYSLRERIQGLNQRF